MGFGFFMNTVTSLLVIFAYAELYRGQAANDDVVDQADIEKTLNLWIAITYISFVQQVILLFIVIKRIVNNDALVTRE